MAKPPVMVGDFNVDGRADLVTVESGGTESLVFVWPGKREGVFSRRLLSRVPPLDARLLLKGDFNRDGKPDLAAANPGGSEIVLLTGMGDGTFRSGPPLDIEKGSEGSYKTDYVGAGDFDGDKIPDLLVRRTATLNDPQEWKVYHGNGDGDFGQVHIARDVASKPGNLTYLGDFNNDGRDDLLVENLGLPNLSDYTVDGYVTIFFSQGDGTFATKDGSSFVHRPFTEFLIQDLDGDGKLDLASTGMTKTVANTPFPCLKCYETKVDLSVRYGQGDGTFSRRASYPVPASERSRVIGSGDFNADSRIDLLFKDGPQIYVFPRTMSGDYADPETVRFPDSPGVWIGDFNGDRSDDMAVKIAWNDPLTVWYGRTGPLALGDVNLDGHVNVTDAILTLQFIVGGFQLDVSQQANGDMDRNYTLDVRDAVLILRRSLNLL